MTGGGGGRVTSSFDERTSSMEGRGRVHVRPSLTRRATETLAEASGGGVAVLSGDRTGQNRESAAEEKGFLKAECEGEAGE